MLTSLELLEWPPVALVITKNCSIVPKQPDLPHILHVTELLKNVALIISDVFHNYLVVYCCNFK